jgi:hypothetical protein
MARSQYSFGPPAGFALVGGSTSVAGALAPLAGGPGASAGGGARRRDGSALPAGASLARELSPSGESGWPEGLPIGLRQDRERARNREALMRSGAPPRRGRVEEVEAPGALSRLSPRPPEPVESRQLGGAIDMEELCEELIARLRRELLVERERMGTPFGV